MVVPTATAAIRCSVGYMPVGYMLVGCMLVGCMPVGYFRSTMGKAMGGTAVAAAMLEEMPVELPAELLVGLPAGLWERPRRDTPQAGRRALFDDARQQVRTKKTAVRAEKMKLDIDTFTQFCSASLQR